MTLTNIIHCFSEAQNDIICIEQHPLNEDLLLAGSQDNCIYLFDLTNYITLAKIEDCQDSVTHVKWVDANKFMCSSLDGSIKLYQYDPSNFPVPVMISDSSSYQALSHFRTYKYLVFALSEFDEFYVVSFQDLQNPVFVDSVYTEKLVDFQVAKGKIILVGKQFKLYNITSREQKDIPLQFQNKDELNPTTSYMDQERELLLVGYDSGQVFVFQFYPTQDKIKHVDTLQPITTASVNVIQSYTIYQRKYYYIGTNDALYIYEQNFTLRNVVKLLNQGISMFQFRFADVIDQQIVQSQQLQETEQVLKSQFSSVQLICGLTDGDIAVFDALSLEKLCDFDVLAAEDEEETKLKPVLCLLNLKDKLIVSGDTNIYIFENDFIKIKREMEKLEETSFEEHLDEQQQIE